MFLKCETGRGFVFEALSVIRVLTSQAIIHNVTIMRLSISISDDLAAACYSANKDMVLAAETDEW